MNSTPPRRGGFFTIVAWQHADDLAVAIYQITKDFPTDQRYTLASQMQRAAVSVAANIAEGSGRQSIGEYIRFLYIARGSLTEVEYYIHLARRLGYLSTNSETRLSRLQRITAGALNGFITFKENQRQQRRH